MKSRLRAWKNVATSALMARMDPLTVFLQAVVSGISMGCVYALVALGFVLVYKATEVVNFAQGELMMVGAFFAYTLVDLGGMPFIPGVLLALVVTAVFGVALNHLLLRPLIGSPAFTIVLATVAVSTLLRSVVGMVPGWGVETHRLSNPLAAENAARKAMEHGLRRVDVMVKGPGSGRETAIRALQAVGLEVSLIKDVTPIPHNGCRADRKSTRLNSSHRT